MLEMTISIVRRNLSSVLNTVRSGQPIILKNRNREIAVIVPLRYLRMIEDIEDSEVAKEAMRENKYVSWDEAKTLLGLTNGQQSNHWFTRQGR